ncbi:hypothetical protein B0E41_17345 [Hydrogenophaga sp. A37]|uniref:hypothetical protein n=1 Tax=Hydrogenophaga sp. A37 TaxID=1945864 RepID=UPI0009863DE7|nr:hypothetical protein [Hydrogenophaga sp. A37]OOG81526.1 hypothetical protein B0E41_17345 [Hydrogenophaga sp. A37]
MAQLWLLAAAFAAGSAVGGAASWQLGRAPLRIENADLREAHTESVRKAVTAAAQRVQDAQTRSDTLGARLSTTLAANATLTKEKTRALQSATSGRACLSGRALGVLNGSTGISVAGAGVPAPQPRAAAAGGAPAAPAHAERQDSPSAGLPADPAEHPALEATDTAVAVWIATAGQQYEGCRERLNALISWHTNPQTKSPTEGQRP